MAYTLDQESLKQFGVPEKFEPLFGNVFKGEDGGIYEAYGETMHLLAKNSTAYRIFRSTSDFPFGLAEMQSKIYTPSQAGDKLRKAVEDLHRKWKDVCFFFVTENIYTHEQKVFAKSATDYGELPDWDFVSIGGAAKALIAGGILMIKGKDCYEIINFIPFFEATANSTLFWAGDQELLEAYFEAGKLKFRYFGRIEKFRQTAVSNLLEVKKDEGKYALYHLGRNLNFVAYSPFKNGFEIKETTGTVVCHSAICSCGVQDVTRAYIFRNGRYERHD
ncbi:MAG: hypothetical protein IJ770_00360 [Alphaproteobacteria bacterium]|nr:hypothetical protein [Alphaproteobacteria bacterium]